MKCDVKYTGTLKNKQLSFTARDGCRREVRAKIRNGVGLNYTEQENQEIKMINTLAVFSPEAITTDRELLVSSADMSAALHALGTQIPE